MTRNEEDRNIYDKAVRGVNALIKEYENDGDVNDLNDILDIVNLMMIDLFLNVFGETKESFKSSIIANKYKYITEIKPVDKFAVVGD